jgi:DNA mismatch repair protein MutS2
MPVNSGRMQRPPSEELVNPHALEALEFERIRDLLVARAASVPGQQLARALSPLTDLEQVHRQLRAVGELQALRATAQGWPGFGFPDVREPLAHARIEGEVLEPGALRSIARLLDLAADVGRFFADEASARRCPELSGLARGLLIERSFSARIERTLDPGGEVRDDASGGLRTLRHRLRRGRQALASRLEHMSRAVGAGGEETLVTLRGGRYVLSVAASEKRRIPGIVHDRSATGKTLYLEPLEIVEQNNEIAELEADERAEVHRILLELTRWVREHGPALNDTLQTLAAFDEWNARARLASELRASLPSLDVGGEALRIVKGRHPLLYLAHGERVVPLDLTLEGGLRGIVVSGPNMGGKTVVLKTIGLIVLMALCGLFVPAADGTVVPWIDGLFVDLGDEQSLESDLSTYAARLRNMRAMLTDAGARSLVLIDELGAGTDPEEGAALGQALLAEVGRRNAFCVVSTHHGAFKTFAADAAGFENASVDYDAETLRPTYRLRVGVPGRSHAFELARREGWPESVLANATARRAPESVRTEGLLHDVDSLRQELERVREALERERAAVDAEREHFRKLSGAFRDKMESIRVEKALEEDRRLREMHALLRELRERLNRTETAPTEPPQPEVRTWFHEQERSVAALEKTRRPAHRRRGPEGRPLAIDEIRPGCHAFARSLGVTVEVLEWAPQRGHVWVSHRGKRVALPPGDLSSVPEGKVGAEQARALPSGVKAYLEAQDAAQETVHGEIDLRGMRAEECLTLLETYIDRALLAGYPRVRIVHGKGEGILRREVRRFLESHAQVRAFRDGEDPEGGWGVTIAFLGSGTGHVEPGSEEQ